ncbi:hypothetical protein BLS_008399 [Venturia inaequalis]|uniref:Uncharacterized protein n=1 Tax=Venturia inaequalis TaxID=5025 RepID=A0A8H3U751_VENIN|nr:hypothetical protein BLS_008399 [Venturia inaequalis]KAE9994872.1 hypothetical protein EG327_000086 [Venturia inaequalis]
MRSKLKIILVACLAAQAAASSEIRIAKSCYVIGDAIASAINTAKAAGLALDNPKPDIQELAEHLFGNEASIAAAKVRLNKIGAIIFAPPDTVSAERVLWEDKKEMKKEDIVVFCDLSRFERDANGEVFWDNQNAQWFGRKSYAEWNSNRENTEAETVSEIDGDNGSLVGASIYVFPWYIKQMQARKNMEGFTAVLNNDPKAIAMIAEVVKGIGRNWNYYKDKGMASGHPMARMDIVHAVLDGTMLHELSHTWAAGISEDVDGARSYGWGAAVEMKNPKNADSLSLFAYAVKVVQSTRFEVDIEGDIADYSTGIFVRKSKLEKRRDDEIDRMIREILDARWRS